MPPIVCKMCGCEPDCVYDGLELCYPCRVDRARESWAVDNAHDAAADNVECECNADKACAYCIDDELYGAITTTQQGKPESITLNWCIGSHQGCECPNCHGGC